MRWTLLSWVGDNTYEKMVEAGCVQQDIRPRPTLSTEFKRVREDLINSQVDPGDDNPDKYLWNKELDRFMAIDFERAPLIPKAALGPHTLD